MLACLLLQREASSYQEEFSKLIPTFSGDGTLNGAVAPTGRMRSQPKAQSPVATNFWLPQNTPEPYCGVVRHVGTKLPTSKLEVGMRVLSADLSYDISLPKLAHVAPPFPLAVVNVPNILPTNLYLAGVSPLTVYMERDDELFELAVNIRRAGVSPLGVYLTKSTTVPKALPTALYLAGVSPLAVYMAPNED